MECQFRARTDAAVLMDYCAGRLDPRAAATLDEHLAACGDCRNWVESQRAVWAALDEWTEPPVSAGFDRRLYEKLGQLERPAWWRLWLKPAFSLAGVAVLAFGLLVTREPQPGVAPPQHQAAADMLDLERLEQALEDAEMLRELSFL